MWLDRLTWKTLGALTSDASAEDRVAEKIPAEIRGAKPDTKLITCETNTRTRWCLCFAFAKAAQQLKPAESRVQKCQGCDTLLPGSGEQQPAQSWSSARCLLASFWRHLGPTSIPEHLPACKRIRNIQMLDLCTSVCRRQTKQKQASW